MAKVLAIDLDGTLFYPKQFNRCIPTINVTFLRRWCDCGNKIVLITSRSYEFCQKLKEEIQRPFDLICCNSSQVYIDDVLIREKSIPRKDIQNITNKIRKKYNPLCFLATSRNYPLIMKIGKNAGKVLFLFYKFWERCQGPYREKYLISKRKFDQELEKGDIFKMMVFFGFGPGKKKFTKDLNKQFITEFPSAEFSWVGKVIEVTPRGCSKAQGLEFYLEKTGIERKNLYVIGDSGNDISMFNKFYDNSFVMSHANKSVKKYARIVVPHVSALENYLLPKK